MLFGPNVFHIWTEWLQVSSLSFISLFQRPVFIGDPNENNQPNYLLINFLFKIIGV